MVAPGIVVVGTVATDASGATPGAEVEATDVWVEAEGALARLDAALHRAGLGPGVDEADDADQDGEHDAGRDPPRRPQTAAPFVTRAR